jgi:catechol 2,3-dioxygenase-like lactoylglutathione lyase family enzyme
MAPSPRLQPRFNANKRIEFFGGRPPQQIGLLVADIDSSLKLYASVLGIGPWSCYTYGPDTLVELTYRGSPGTFSMKLALSDTDPQLELIQPLTGPSIYDDWLRLHGGGLHHIAYTVDDIHEAIAVMEEAGYPLIQFGCGYGYDGDGAFAYFETTADFGTIIEARELPSKRRPPDSIVNIGGDQHRDGVE